MAEFNAEAMDLNREPKAIRLGVQAAKILLPGIMVDRHQGRMRSVLPRLALNAAEVVGYQTTVMAWATGHNELVVPMLGAIAAKKVLGSVLERRENRVIQEDTGMSKEEMQNFKNETPPVKLVGATLKAFLPSWVSNKLDSYINSGPFGGTTRWAGAIAEAVGAIGVGMGVAMGSAEIAATGAVMYLGGRGWNLVVERMHNLRNNRR